MEGKRKVIVIMSEQRGPSCISQLKILKGDKPTNGDILLDPVTGKEWTVLGEPIGAAPCERSFLTPALRGIGHQDTPDDGAVLTVNED